MNRTLENAVRPGTSSTIKMPHTPRTWRHRQRFDLSTRLEEDEEIDISGLEELVGKTWNIHAVSALFGFQQDDIHFKLYSKKLREEIASTLSRENLTYDAKFSLIEDIAFGPNHKDHPTIKIEVIAKTSDDSQKVIYNGILLFWSTQIEPNIQNYLRLPLLLCRGTRSCMDAVHIIIGHMFDCLVIALSANNDDLNWFVPIIIMSTNNEKPTVSGEIQMEYVVPELPITDTITVKFQISDLRKILSAIIINQNETMNISLDRKHIEMFYEVLHAQMLALGGLHLGKCTLHKINLPGVTIMENKMKVLKAEIMNLILLYLNEKAYDTFHSVHIDI